MCGWIQKLLQILIILAWNMVHIFGIVVSELPGQYTCYEKKENCYQIDKISWCLSKYFSKLEPQERYVEHAGERNMCYSLYYVTHFFII